MSFERDAYKMPHTSPSPTAMRNEPYKDDDDDDDDEDGDELPVGNTKISQMPETDMDYSQWQVGANGRYRAAARTVPNLVAGVYKIEQDEAGLFLQLQNVISDNIVELPETANTYVLNGMKKFWTCKAQYEKFGFVYKRGVLLWGPPGCHSAGTEVIMYDGKTKKVENVVEGDLLMGPDSTPRQVVALCRGRDEMFRVQPVIGDAFDVNGHHVLPLRLNENSTINEVLVKNYSTLSNWEKSQLKLWKPNATSGKPNKNPLHTGIRSVTSIGIGDYFGFILDKDHLYQTKDFFVNHNSGKSVTINLLMKELISLNGIVLLCGHPEFLAHMLQRIRQMEPDRPIIVVLEDIDEIIEKHGEHAILSMLDGENQIANVVYLACPAPETRILKTDLTWVRADSLRKGDKIIAFDENGPDRKYRTAIVNSAPLLERPRYKVTTEKGTTIVSENHPFLVRMGNRPYEWRFVQDIRSGNRIAFATHRLLNHPQLPEVWEGNRLCADRVKVLSVEYLGLGPVIGLDTTTNTFIGEGMLQHNTTNYPERLGARIVNRPSRFDERIKVGMPSSAARRAYLKFAATDLDDENLDKWVSDTDGFSIAHLRELVAACYCLDQPYKVTLKRLKSMCDKPKFQGGFRKGNAGFSDDEIESDPDKEEAATTKD